MSTILSSEPAAENTVEPLTPFAVARAHMIESQLRPNGVRSEAVLQAMGSLPRELFVPQRLEGIAYIDEDIAVAPDRYLLEPMVLARLLEAANITAADHALDIGAATGYSTAVMASIARVVVALDPDAQLMAEAEHNLRQLGFDNVTLCVGALADGVADSGPYDVIVMNGSVDAVADSLLDQLAEGGRLVTVVRRFGPAYVAHFGEARLYRRQRGHVSHRALFDANVKPLPGCQTPRAFHF